MVIFVLEEAHGHVKGKRRCHDHWQDRAAAARIAGSCDRSTLAQVTFKFTHRSSCYSEQAILVLLKIPTLPRININMFSVP